MIRAARIEDGGELVPLMADLGYPSSERQIQNRLQRILSHDHYQTYVYETNEGLCGMIGMTFNDAYHTDDPHIRVIAFVVAASEQGKGIGKKLMKEAESWAFRKGAKTVVLNSGNREDRKAAHHIYHSLGFEGRATGFYKRMDE